MSRFRTPCTTLNGVAYDQLSTECSVQDG
ncbi:hypothetical protein TNCV_1557651, partial [Trichonephila clavipes]